MNAKPDRDSEALSQKGKSYARGKGVPQNYTEAVKWWRKAAEQNHVKAQLILGSHYDVGLRDAKG